MNIEAVEGIPPFTEEELKQVGKKIKPGKAPRPDGIPSEVARIVIEVDATRVLQILNEKLREESFPEKWKRACLVLIPKGMPEERKFRPICLLDTIGKVKESLIKGRIMMVLGPTQWNIYFDSVMNIDLLEDTQVLCYADDTATIVSAETRESIESKARRAYGRVDEEIRRKGLEVAHHKTEMVILNGGRNLKEIEVECGGRLIQRKECIKYLGVIFDRNMRMGKPVEHACRKDEKAIAALGRLMPRIEGPSEGKRRVCSVGHSIMLYGAPAWMEAIKWENTR